MSPETIKCMPSPCLLLVDAYSNTHVHSNAYGNPNSESYPNTEGWSNSAPSPYAEAARIAYVMVGMPRWGVRRAQRAVPTVENN